MRDERPSVAPAGGTVRIRPISGPVMTVKTIRFILIV